MASDFLKSFAIKGLHYYRDFHLSFEDEITILVGENGLGKTTVLNILYALLQGRWAFLEKIGFDFVEVHFKNGKAISFSHSELEAFLIISYYQDNKIPQAENELEIINQTVKGISRKFAIFERIRRRSVTNPILFLPSGRGLRNYLSLVGKRLESLKRVDSAEADEYEAIEKEILIPLELTYLKNLRINKIKEKDLSKFLKVVNTYLLNIRLVSDGYQIKAINIISNEHLSFDQFSSGEKQILYIFSYVYLVYQKDLIILFDEPELSLSLPWQRKILTDIVNSGKCSFLFAITHSPFVFDNDLEKFAKGINMFFKDYGTA
jgi:predicted ATPase